MEERGSRLRQRFCAVGFSTTIRFRQAGAPVFCCSSAVSGFWSPMDSTGVHGSDLTAVRLECACREGLCPPAQQEKTGAQRTPLPTALEAPDSDSAAACLLCRGLVGPFPVKSPRHKTGAVAKPKCGPWSPSCANSSTPSSACSNTSSPSTVPRSTPSAPSTSPLPSPRRSHDFY